jgi:hypothetical protein
VVPAEAGAWGAGRRVPAQAVMIAARMSNIARGINDWCFILSSVRAFVCAASNLGTAILTLRILLFISFVNATFLAAENERAGSIQAFETAPAMLDLIGLGGHDVRLLR